MTLIIGATPNSQWQTLTPLLESLGWTGQEPSFNVTALGNDSLTENRGDNLYLLLHSRPERALARALQQGEILEEALVTWLETARSLLCFYLQRPQSAILLDAESAAKHPKEVLKWLHENRSEFIQSGVKRVTPFDRIIESEEIDALYLIIATQAVTQHPGASDILEELEAASIPIESGSFTLPTVNLDELTARVSQERSSSKLLLEKLKADQDGIKRQHQEENELLTLQLHKTQEELEKKYYELKELRQDAEGTLQDAVPEGYRRMLDQSRQENELLLLQLHNLQEELERYYFESTKLSGEPGTKNLEIKELKEERRRLAYELHQSRVLLSRSSIKARTLSMLRAPLRAFRKLSPSKRRIPQQLKMVRQSDLFDPQWYLEKNPDIQKSNVDPLVHFVLHGGQEGRAPSKWFSSEWYLDRYKDVADAGMNPLVHYLMSGKDEGRDISPGKH